ncbi:MAG: class I SAM-dependent methyltransferase [Nitrospirota bacterium]|nr:class I SAM-dependent methyltransferase [Nitrospirota bacterium]
MTEGRFPDWTERYAQGAVAEMPWYHEGLDPDVEAAMSLFGVSSGRVLDMGSGPGTQAVELARRDFSVTGADVAEGAVTHGRELAARAGVKVDFVHLDLLEGDLTPLGVPFDLVLDRGLLHAVAPSARREYVRRVAAMVARGGLLMVKCFSWREPGEDGPHRFDPEDIRLLFEKDFHLQHVKDTVFHGTLNPPPHALLAVLRRR